VVAISEPGLPCRSLELQVAGHWVDEEQSSNIGFSGFTTPASLPVTARLLLGGIEGDANLNGDSVAIDDPIGIGLITLSGPNNPADNFFASQINNVSGILDTQGSWGAVNHNALTASNTVGGRQGWANTGLLLHSEKGHLTTNQGKTTIASSSSGDGFVLAYMALEIDSDPGLCPLPPLIHVDGFEDCEGTDCP